MSDDSLRYTELQGYVQNNDCRKIISIANKLLRSKECGIEVFKCKIVALINLERFDDALRAFLKFPEFKKHTYFEEAYCFYRLNEDEKALKVLGSTSDKNKLHFLELKAQIFYRQERFGECYEIYREIMKQSSDEIDDERKTNILASIAHLASQGRVIDISSIISGINSAETYELLFNAACYLMFLEKFDQAECYLSAAEDLCKISFDEDTSQKEISCDLLMIKTQLACCKQFTNEVSQALDKYSKILDNKPTDNGVIAVTNNNILAAEKDINNFEAKKKMKILLAVMSKLTTLQRRIVTMNTNQIKALRLLSCNEALNACNKFAGEYPESVEGILLLKVAILLKHNKLDEAINVVKENLRNCKESKLKMSFALTQLYLNLGKYNEAIEVLMSLGDDIFRPGIVSTLVTILTTLGDSAGGASLLESAIEWNKLKKTAEFYTLCEHVSDFHLRQGHTELALQGFEELLRNNPQDIKILAKLTLGYSKFNPSKAFHYYEKLKKIFNIEPPTLDLNLLESGRWMTNGKTLKKCSEGQSTQSLLPAMNKKPRNKKRKKIFPKNYDPQVTPDPERWLPMHERSYYRKKKDRRNKDIGKGSQGVVSSIADSLDMSKVSSKSKEKHGHLSLEERKLILTRKIHKRKNKKN